MRHPARPYYLTALAMTTASMAAAIVVTGCAAPTPPVQAPSEAAPEVAIAAAVSATPAKPAIEPAGPTELTPVIRSGRYTLVELVPEPAQRDLMRQVIQIVIPPSLDATVGDALRHVLRRSGYRLCDAPEAGPLYELPLPAAHLRLGPLMLRDALLVLAGPAWDVSIDDGARQVCFERHTPPPPLPAPSAASEARASHEQVRP